MHRPPTDGSHAAPTEGRRDGAYDGHVFVVKGTLESVASDVLIVPASSRFVPRRTWWRALGIDTEPPVAAGEGRARRFPDEVGFSRPAWILNVAHDGRPSVPWLIDGLADALRKISADPPPTGDGRVRPLIAMPTLGVGLGGYDGVRGAVIKALLERTAEFVRSSAFDIVIVAENAADYAAFQSIRRGARAGSRHGSTAKRLAALVRTGDVALLLGAGVSVPAGLPTWDELLSRLKQETLPDLDEANFSELNVLDRAQLLSKLSGTTSLGSRAASAIMTQTKKSPTLAHCLLASLSVGKAVTTNYDTLYEDAYKSAHGPESISVLPREEVFSDRAWLLKLHGDVAAPDSIVLSRRDFVRYDSQRRPLASIVQSLMATSHLIVIGASMTDDNVLRLAHEVLAMNAVNEHERPLGTVVTLRKDHVRTELWRGDFDFVAASKSSDDAIAARDLEILLDSVAMHATERAPFLLDSRYGEILDKSENQIADDLRGVAERLRDLNPSRRDQWSPVEGVLTSMGHVMESRPPVDRDRVTFDDLIDAYFSAAQYKDKVEELRDYHNLRRDILVDLFDCPLPSIHGGAPGHESEFDRHHIIRVAHNCLKQSSNLYGPFTYYMEGMPGPLEKHLLDKRRPRLDRALEDLKQQYHTVFADVLVTLYPGNEVRTFPRSILFERGLPKTEPELWEFD